MDRMKTFFKYAMFLLVFYIFSNILINVGLNMRFNEITSKEDLSSQIAITQAEATRVNGRIKGNVKNTQENNINGKYLKVDLYKNDNTLMGTNYIAINDINVDESQDFEVYFKMQDIEYYDINIVNTAEQTLNSELFLDDDLKTTAVFALIFYLCVI